MPDPADPSPVRAVQRGGKWVVVSKDGRKLDEAASQGAAEARANEINAAWKRAKSERRGKGAPEITEAVVVGSFDPHAHPRDRLGKFRDVLHSLGYAQSIKLPSGVTVTHAGSSFQVRRPGQSGGTDLIHLTAGAAAQQALDLDRTHGAHTDGEHRERLLSQLEKLHERKRKGKAHWNAFFLPIAHEAVRDVYDAEIAGGRSPEDAFMETFEPTREMRSVAKKLGFGLDVERGRWVRGQPGSKMSRRSGHDLLVEATEERKLAAAAGDSEAFVRARAREETLREGMRPQQGYAFDPHEHPRDRLGKFVDVLKKLVAGTGGDVRLPHGFVVTRKRGVYSITHRGKKVGRAVGARSAATETLSRYDEYMRKRGTAWTARAGVQTERVSTARPSRAILR